jgi:hypothetical protein
LPEKPGKFLSPIINKPPNGEMSDELDKIQAEETNGLSTQIERDQAFCTCMRAAIEAGLESAPIGIVTTPGTKNPRYMAPEPRPLVSSQREVEHA